MTNLKQNDKVTIADGRAGVVRQVNSAGTAALVDSGSGKTFDSNWFSVDSLTKGKGRAKDDEPAESGYLVTFKSGDDVTYTVAVEKAADEAAAIAAAQADDSHTEGDEVAGVEQVA